MKPTTIYATLATCTILVMVMYMCERSKLLNERAEAKHTIEIQSQNLRAAGDRIRRERTKSNFTEAVKSAYIAKIADLESLNAALAKEVKETKGRVVSIITTNTITSMQPITLDNALHDYPDSVTHGIGFKVFQSDAGASWELEGESKFRLANGRLSAGKTTISKNQVMVRLTLGFKEVGSNYEVFARSASPSVYIDSLDGALIIPKVADLNQPIQRVKRFGLGVFAGYGISTDLKPRPYLGAGIGWNLIRF